jgi:hypothetical protein
LSLVLTHSRWTKQFDCGSIEQSRDAHRKLRNREREQRLLGAASRREELPLAWSLSEVEVWSLSEVEVWSLSEVEVWSLSEVEVWSLSEVEVWSLSDLYRAESR